ncbi:PepSY domain-containing protein [Thiolapillus sp.]
MMRYAITGTLLLALLLVLATLWMADREWRDYEHGNDQVPQLETLAGDTASAGPLPLLEIIQRLRLPEDTRILEIKQEHSGHGMHYDIELVTAGGRIYKLSVDPYTAKIIETEEAHETAAGGR